MISVPRSGFGAGRYDTVIAIQTSTTMTRKHSPSAIFLTTLLCTGLAAALEPCRQPDFSKRVACGALAWSMRGATRTACPAWCSIRWRRRRRRPGA